MTTFSVVTDPPSGGGRNSWFEGTTFGNPNDGGYVHVVGTSDLAAFPAGGKGGPAWPGMIFRIEAAESFLKGTDLATNGAGRARTATTGDVKVAEALEGSTGAGDVVWVVVTTQRTL